MDKVEKLVNYIISNKIGRYIKNEEFNKEAIDKIFSSITNPNVAYADLKTMKIIQVKDVPLAEQCYKLGKIIVLKELEEKKEEL